MERPCFSTKWFPLFSAGPQKPQILTALKVKYEKFGPQILISLKNGIIGAPIFQEIWFFEHLRYNFKTSWPQKIQFSKLYLPQKLLLFQWLKWLIGKNEVLFVVHEFQNFDSLQTCIKSADQKNNELHN